MNIENAIHSWPVIDNFLPDFTLPSSDGQPIDPRDYRNRSHLVLVFAGDPTGAGSTRLLPELARHYEALTAEGAQVLAIVPRTVAEAARVKEGLSLPFPVLADPDMHVHREYGAVSRDGRSASDAVYVAGRYGKVYLASRATDGPPLPGWHDILGSLRYVESQCPECGEEGPMM